MVLVTTVVAVVVGVLVGVAVLVIVGDAVAEALADLEGEALMLADVEVNALTDGLLGSTAGSIEVAIKTPWLLKRPETLTASLIKIEAGSINV